jgi:serine protease
MKVARFVQMCVLFAWVFAWQASANDPARVWVQFAPGQKAPVKVALQGAGGHIHYEFDDLSAMAVTVPAAALAGLRQNPNVTLIEDDPIRELVGQTVPYGIDMVQARDVWDANRDGVVDEGSPTGSGCRVCVIDSGVYVNHEDFAGVNIAGESGTPTAWNIDGCGHGTHVVGTIVAANNSKGVVGVTPGTAAIYMVKVFGDDCRWAYSSDLVYAARRCQAVGARIISMSLGGSFKSSAEESAFDQLYNEGILSVAAAGNSGNTRHSYPASYPSVISVAAVNKDEVVADFSQKNNQVELAAPGVGVLSTVPYLTPKITVDGADYHDVNHIENAAYGTASGALVNGGLCDSVGSWAGKVVLCERGSITFNEKVRNVQNGGGVAAVIYNNAPGNFYGTLGSGNSSAIPAVSISQADGQYLVANKLNFTATVSDPVPDAGSGYAAWNGTSMATPHVSAVAALVWNCDASRSNTQIREALQLSAKDLGPAGRDNSYGYGLVQAKAALDYLGGDGTDPGQPGNPDDPGDDPEDTTPPVISNVASRSTHRNGTFEITWTTDEPATSVVIFTCCGTHSDSTLVTNHRMTFKGRKGVTYEYWVSSADAAGNQATAGPFYHNN